MAKYTFHQKSKDETCDRAKRLNEQVCKEILGYALERGINPTRENMKE